MFIDAPTDNCRVSVPVARPLPVSLAGLAQVAVASVGDAQDRMGMMNAGIRSQWPGARCGGSALTVDTREGDNLAIHRALDEVRPGDVLVVNGRGDTNRAVFGDLLAEICLARQVAGVVIDGVARDIDAIEQLRLPLWARGVTPAGPTKTGPGVIGEPIACGGVVVATGDLVFADADGIAIVRRDRLDAVLARLAAIERVEDRLRQRIRATSVEPRPHP